jgi:C4-dicarboxylate transporter
MTDAEPRPDLSTNRSYRIQDSHIIVGYVAFVLIALVAIQVGSGNAETETDGTVVTAALP